MDIPRTAQTKLFRKLKRRMLRTVTEFGLIEANDKIMVAVSGGKDSYTLFDMLCRARKTSPVPFEVIAVHLDQQQPGYDGAPLKSWLEDYGQPFEILSRNTYALVLSLTKEGGTYCSPCSRLRRGVLYDAAERMGCNKIALGHHRDDAIETVMMNMIYSGKLQAMPATYTTDDGRFQVIRPLIECAEADIAEFASLAGYPILPCNLCGSQSGLKRIATKRLLDQIQLDVPNVREVMLAALKNVVPSHLLDRNLAAATTHFRPIPEPKVASGAPLLTIQEPMRAEQP